MLVWLMVLGPLSWWWVGYRSWGGLTAGLLAVMGLWLMCGLLGDDHTVRGHPFYVVLAVPAVILACHFVRHALFEPPLLDHTLSGSLDLSMLFHLALLAGAVLLTQNFFPGAARHVAVLAMCGAAMMVGSVAAVAWQQTVEARNALALLGLAGVAVWLSLLWGLAPQDDLGAVPPPLRRRDLRLACIAVAVAATVVFASLAPRATVWAGVVVGGALILGGVLFPRRRVVLLVVGGVLAGGGLHVMALLSGPVARFDFVGARCFGSGEEAFGRLSAGDNGLAILIGTVGWAGFAWVMAAAFVCAVWLLLRAAQRGADQGRAVVWVAATALASSSVLAGGGAFIPTALLAVAFTWGMLPAMLGRTPRRHPGTFLLVPVLILMLAMGIGRSAGLVNWMSGAFGYGDKMLHVAGGVVLAAVSVWLVGSKRWWAGLLAIAVVALLGGAGELLQLVVAWRGGDLADWGAHAVGSGLVAVPYLLCVGSRLCESAEAASDVSGAEEAGGYDRPGIPGGRAGE